MGSSRDRAPDSKCASRTALATAAALDAVPPDRWHRLPAAGPIPRVSRESRPPRSHLSVLMY